MSRIELDDNFSRINDLIKEIDGFVPANGYQNIQFRADLAGLLVVAMASTYENCVKEILESRARRCHQYFGDFAERNFKKLNSRVQVRDLKNYCELFGPEVHKKFADGLKFKKKAILDRTGKNIETAFETILAWRHDYAHAGIRNTTIEEAAKTHTIGKRVLYVFDQAFI